MCYFQVVSCMMSEVIIKL